MRAPGRVAYRIARALAVGTAAALVLPALVLLAAAARLGTTWRRRTGRTPRLVWGPEPLISIKFWSEAMRHLGYESTTLVHSFYAINQRHDFDLYRDEFLGSGNLSRLMRDYFVFAWTLRHADVHLTFFDGGFLRATPLRSLEAALLRLAGKKLIVSPYGSDIAVPGHLGAMEEGMLEDYPQLAERAASTRRRVDYFARWGDVIVRNCQNGYMPRQDVLWVTQLAIDVAADHPASSASPQAGKGDEVVVVHAPNHQHVKGTSALVRAVDELRAEGLLIRLDLYERRPNEEVRDGIQNGDVIADQFLAGYGMFAIEGLTAGKPVMSALSGMPAVAARAAVLRSCPIVDVDTSTITAELRRLAENPARRRSLGEAGRAFAERYHSPEEVARCWETILRSIWGDGALPRELPEPKADTGL